MKKIKNINAMRLLKLIHILGAGMFIGGIGSLLILLLYTVDSAILELIMDSMVLMGMRVLILSGFVYGLFTNYGFKKYTWVWMKWVVTIVAMFCLNKLTINVEAMLLQSVFIVGLMVLSEYRFHFHKVKVQ